MQLKKDGLTEASSILVKQAREMPGFDFLKAILNGELPSPPLLETLDFRLTSVGNGKTTFSIRPQPIHYNGLGVVHGGIITTILDSAMSCSLHSLLPLGTLYTTLELKVNFFKSVTIQTGELTAEGHIIHKGRSTAVMECTLVDEDDNKYAHGVSTCLIFDKNQ